MQNNDNSSEPRLSAQRMAALDNHLAPRAEVEARIVGALHGHGVLRDERNAFAVTQAANSRRRTMWLAGLAAVAATVMFFAGVKVGEGRSNAAAALASNAAAVDARGATCPPVTVAAIPGQSQLIWY